jgi:arabinan endo-1,5-alpha-L-arabinosidase
VNRGACLPCAIFLVCAIALGLPACAQTSTNPPSARSQPSPTSEPHAIVAHNGAALDRDFPDPAVLRLNDGTFYAYATQTVTASRTVNVQVARSTNLKAWAYLGEALPNKPSWARTTQSFWAPHVIQRGHAFYMYYSAVPDDSTGDENCLGIATSKTPEGPFTDVGKALLCGYEIDPDVFHDPRSKNWFMYWGSAGDIAVQRMSDDLVHLEGASQGTALQGWSSLVRRPYEHGIEGPFVIYRGGWYYLFYSGDKCCALPPHYAVMVARSRHPEGPFQRLATADHEPGSVILSDAEPWLGPGHCSVVLDANGQMWIAYHAIDERYPTLPSGDIRRVMLLQRLRFKNGWPLLASTIKGSG